MVVCNRSGASLGVVRESFGVFWGLFGGRLKVVLGVIRGHAEGTRPCTFGGAVRGSPIRLFAGRLGVVWEPFGGRLGISFGFS